MFIAARQRFAQLFKASNTVLMHQASPAACTFAVVFSQQHVQ